jgi:N-acetylglucosaminyl-diphospho-decaprenol L-rhamnosyltransferase
LSSGPNGQVPPKAPPLVGRHATLDRVQRQTVAVVVVTWNSEGVLHGLIESLDAGLDGLDWHLVVADNASADGSVELVGRLAPEATIVQTGRNAGYAAGINAALAAAGDFSAALVLNPDIRLRPGAGKALMAGLERPGTGIVVPRLYDGGGRLTTSLFREPTPLRMLGDALVGGTRAGRYPAFGEMVVDEAAYHAETTADWASGSILLVSAECLRRCGPWDESFFLYSEETDFALRARDAGFALRLVPDAVAVHLEGDAAVSPRLWTLLTLNRVRLYRQRHGPAATAAFWLTVLVRELSRAVVFRNRPSWSAVRGLLSPQRLRAVPGP